MLEIARQNCPGAPFYQGNLVDFVLSKCFDVIVSLFSAIGYVKTVERLNQAANTLYHHLNPGGVVVIEPWFTPDTFHPDTLHALFLDEPDLKIARMNISRVEGRLSILDLHYLIGTPEGIEYTTELHELGLFTQHEYMHAFQSTGLETIYDEQGIFGRGLFIGIKVAKRNQKRILGLFN